MNLISLFFLCLVTFNSAYAGDHVNKIKSKEAVDFMLNSDLIYNSPNKVGFVLRAYNYIGDGECVNGKICRKNMMVFITSTFDEYPEKNGFKITYSGKYTSFEILTTPADENQAYVVKLLTENNGTVCKILEIKRKSILQKSDC